MKISQEIIGIVRHGETLKRIERTGWALAGVQCIRQESVGEHSFGTILVSLLISKILAKQGVRIDINKVAFMAILHDLPESMISDIPHMAIELGGEKIQEGKREAEKEAIHLILRRSEFFQETFVNYWDEITNARSIEAQIVLGADIIDMLVHAVTLESAGVSPKNLDQFFTNSYDKLKIRNMEIFEDIFWDLYKEHIDNAKRLGVELKLIAND